jgi:hypothetical protein
MIGEISKSYPMVGKIVESLAKFFGDLADNFGRMFKAIEEGNFIQFWLDEIEIFKKEIKALFDYIKNIDIGGAVSNALGFGDDKPEPIKSVGGTASYSDIPLALQKARIELSAANNNPLLSTGNQTITNATSTIQKNTSLSVGDINVNAHGGDSKEIAANVGNEMNTQFSRVASSYDDGVAG